MGLILGLFAVAVIVIGLVIVLPMFSDSFAKAQESLDELNKATSAGNNPVIGDRVCDLKLKIYGELDFNNQDGKDIFIANPFEFNLTVFINDKIEHQPFIETSWINCHTIGSNSFVGLLGGMSLLDMAQQNKLSSLDVTGISAGDSFTIKIEGENQQGELLVDSQKRISWQKRIIINDGSQITIPFAFNHLFVLDDVVADNYEIKITALEKRLNNGGSNSFITYKVFAP